MWQEFVDNTTLHGIRYVFKKPRHILIRLIWFVLLLTSGGYYIFTVYTAFSTCFDRPINTVVSRKNVEGMDFPAVTICPQNDFAKSKLYMTDDNPLFASTGLILALVPWLQKYEAIDLVDSHFFALCLNFKPSAPLYQTARDNTVMIFGVKFKNLSIISTKKLCIVTSAKN